MVDLPPIGVPRSIHQSDTSENPPVMASIRVEAHPVRTFPVSQSSVGDCRMTNTSPIMSTGIWRSAVLSSSGTPARISLAANHMRASSPGRAWRRHGRLEAARGESSASHIGVFWYVRTHRWFSVLSKRLSVCDFFVELSRSRPTIDPRGRFAIPRLTPILAIGRRRPRRIPPNSSLAWVATISTQAPSRAGGPLGKGPGLRFGSMRARRQ
jgi:hypothetical protein